MGTEPDRNRGGSSANFLPNDSPHLFLERKIALRNQQQKLTYFKQIKSKFHFKHHNISQTSVNSPTRNFQPVSLPTSAEKMKTKNKQHQHQYQQQQQQQYLIHQMHSRKQQT